MLNYFSGGIYEFDFVLEVQFGLLFSDKILMDIPTMVCIRVHHVKDCTITAIVLAGSYQFTGYACGVIPYGLLSPGVIPVGVENYR